MQTEIVSTQPLRVELRAAGVRDAALLFEWRNDPKTRANSRNTAMVAWADHLAWFEATLVNPRRQLLVAEQDKHPVGTSRIDYCVLDCELNWTVAPQSRRQGIGRRIVAATIGIADYPILRAEIKIGNVPSLRIARALEFSEDPARDGLIVFWRRKRF